MHKILILIVSGLLTLACSGCGPSAEERKSEYDAKFKSAQQRSFQEGEAAKQRMTDLQKNIRSMPPEQYRREYQEAMDASLKPMRDFAAEADRLNKEYDYPNKK